MYRTISNLGENKYSCSAQGHVPYKLKAFDILIMSVWVQTGLLYFVGTAITLITGSNTIAMGVKIVYYFSLVVLSTRHLTEKLRLNDLLLFFSMLLIVAISLFNLQNSGNIVKLLPSLFFWVLPSYYIGLSISAEKHTMDLLYTASVITIIANVLYIFIILFTGRELEQDNMAVAYAVLPHSMMVLWYTMKNPRLIRLACSIVSFLFLIGMGTRGPVVSYFAFFVLFSLHEYKTKSKLWRVLFIVIIIITAIVFVTGIWESLLLRIRDILDSMNLSTRVINAILYNEGKYSNEARQRIYTIMWDYIQKQPLIGYGIYGEWMMINYTAHSAVFELWTHYGLIFGSLILIFSLWKVLKIYKKSENPYAKGFILIMVCFGIIRCIYGGSYLSDYIFLLMGVVVNQGRIQNHSLNSTELLNNRAK